MPGCSGGANWFGLVVNKIPPSCCRYIVCSAARNCDAIRCDAEVVPGDTFCANHRRMVDGRIVPRKASIRPFVLRDHD